MCYKEAIYELLLWTTEKNYLTKAKGYFLLLGKSFVLLMVKREILHSFEKNHFTGKLILIHVDILIFQKGSI
jgi:hypothetical protein